MGGSDSGLTESGFAAVCSDRSGRVRLAVDKKGALWRQECRRGASGVPDAGTAETGSWQPVNFNEMYAGYYEPCFFTALIGTRQDFVAAGMQENGLPCVYRSLYGGVWDQTMLAGGNPVTGIIRASGKINGMVYEPLSNQVFMYCDNGELITLPDCPKCVKIRTVTDQAIVAGEIRDKKLGLTLADGQVIEVLMSDVSQYRISYSYTAGVLQSSGGTVVWLGQGAADLVKLTGSRKVDITQKRSDAQNSSEKAESANKSVDIKHISMALEAVPGWLSSQRADSFIAFWCDFGTQADEAADMARRMGFSRAFSLGGAKPLLHVE